MTRMTSLKVVRIHQLHYYTHLVNPVMTICSLSSHTTLAPLLPSGPAPSLTGRVESLGLYILITWSLPAAASCLPSGLHAIENSWNERTQDRNGNGCLYIHLKRKKFGRVKTNRWHYERGTGSSGGGGGGGLYDN